MLILAPNLVGKKAIEEVVFYKQFCGDQELYFTKPGFQGLLFPTD